MNSEQEMKSVLVTGATGFIGQTLVRDLCRQGVHVRILVRSRAKAEVFHNLPAGQIQVLDGDLDSIADKRGDLAGIDTVFHVAGLTREVRCGDFVRVNSESTVRLAECVRDINGPGGSPPVFVYISSLAAAGVACKLPRGGGFRPRSEEDYPQPVSPYGISKCSAEQALAELSDELPITIIRPAIVFGEGDLHGLSLFRMAKKSLFFFTPGYRDREFSYIHVADLSRLILAAAQRGERLSQHTFELIPGTEWRAREKYCTGQGVYFGAAPERMPLSQYGKALAAACGRKRVRAFRTPPVGVWIGAFGSEVVKKIRRSPTAFDLNKAVEAMTGPWICTSQKAESQLKFTFDVPLAVRIQQTVAWYEQAGLL
ncbi:MAG: NAD-dependent epimerase/dehydratase family protein [Planctomycetia bacterium]|nr:NAD-dependent epimerase/dehydratase family protein [Planctomycetia bacterium]